jgi:[ribosomal protein S5]-alanine N-acetyltransferase
MIAPMAIAFVTERLLLRELEEADAPAIHVWESDAAVVRYQIEDVQTLDECLEYIRRNRAEAARDPRRLYEVGCCVRAEGDLLIGRVGLKVVRPDHREGELWFAFRRDRHGQGYATEAARALIRFGFGTLGLHRIFGDCDPRNTASARLMERLGMRREGHLRESWWLKGEWCDSWIYAVLEDELD